MTQAIIIGGGSGMGLALARTLLAEGMDVTIVGRSADRLATAQAQLEPSGQGKISTIVADIAREEDVAALFAQVERVDHVAVTAADATGVYGRTADVATATARSVVATKLLGAWLVGKYAAGRVTDSITYTSGINAYRPNGSNTIMAAANGALASLACGLAIELAPVRVNVVSPGWVDTAIWNQLGMDKQAAFAELAERLPARRVGTPDDIAQAFSSVMHNGFITGTVLHVDGGHRIT
ncbi:NAD(P)-dependent dehydrogenase (short-subunit alcohol dehydrogenase family) [Streptomyces puniciscabiei]|uniref:NAD(P)-dependent dehydrogenase (Short-subunit alcohol dehydrogenase family) n=1 Tax=Streptomyces puniciscabiei TaxID=164348 RepID=A0A542TI46_9ACTN|nr:SDR family oxidoreductase [Streptomyces puniciscabiei]TQK86505.1 NAD(P)-dependent dehydrogenase (short-subunit alcohol dehydrogenase family) [Streptomyces puniciscabiei]